MQTQVTSAFLGRASMSPLHPSQSQTSDSTSPSTRSRPPCAGDDPRQTANPEPLHSPIRTYNFPSFQTHRYRNSASSASASASAASSPMTSVSFVEPPANFDTPATSPDTPASGLSYTYPFQPAQLDPGTSEPKAAFRFAPSPTSIKRQKNPKNLALNTANGPTARAMASASMPLQHPPKPEPQTISPGIASPSFVRPEPPRRKSHALGLTLKTPSNSDTFGSVAQVAPIPPTPALQRPATLHDIPATPLIPHHPRDGPSIKGHAGLQFADPIIESTAEGEQGYEPPESREQKPDAYPNGPVCIYEPYVDLYFEPTAKEASNYDTVFNVASEVKNPFLQQDDVECTVVDLKSAARALRERNLSFKPAVSDQPPSDEQSSRGQHRTEYVHVPWEHNSDLVHGTADIPPLEDIIKLVDDRVNASKRVLIHCQCGVSRSASLIVAYGLYKNSNMTVQEAYDHVKQRSRWIGPNMNLIMQLQDYRNSILLASAERNGQRAKGRGLHGRVQSEDPNFSKSSGPQTAPLPTDKSPKRTPSPIDIDTSSAISAGPSSAPSEMQWPSDYSAEKVMPKPGMVPIYPENSVVVAAADKVLETKDASHSNVPEDENRGRIAGTGASPGPPFTTLQVETIDTAKSEVFAMTPANPVLDDPSFGITSPRESTFPPIASGFGSIGTSGSAFAPLATVPSIGDDPSLGLFSPRVSTNFSEQLPRIPDLPVRPVPVHPTAEMTASNTEERSTLRSKMGFNNNKSMFDLRGERAKSILLSQSARQPLPSLLTGASMPTWETDSGNALMSPRATEFTRNPFHEAFVSANQASTQASPRTAAGATATGGGKKAGAGTDDPRSPAQKGSNPIVRNIMDVLGFSR